MASRVEWLQNTETLTIRMFNDKTIDCSIVAAFLYQCCLCGSIVIVNVWGAIGGGMIIFLAGLQAIPKDYYEVAHLDGAGPWQRLVYVTLPSLAPSIFFQCVLTTINAFQAFDYIYILTRIGNGNSTMPTLVFSIYRSGFRFFRMGDASAQAVVLTAMIFALTLGYFRMPKRWGEGA